MTETPAYARSIVWLRRDLRLDDNVAIARAARSSKAVCIAFNLDPELLRGERVGAPIVQAFFDALGALRGALRERGSDLALLEGDFAGQLLALAERIRAEAVFFNEDYDPHAVARDAEVSGRLRSAGLDVDASVDHVYFAAERIRNGDGEPYKVFTPFRKRWRALHSERRVAPVRSSEAVADLLLPRGEIGETRDIPDPEHYGHASSTNFPRCGEGVASDLLETFLAPGGRAEMYADVRDVPALDSTSHISPQLRAGTIGIRTVFERAFDAAQRRGGDQIEKWIDELIWREFYQMILKSFPYVAAGPFIESASALKWDDDSERFRRWCDGTTGYPIVDAAMRQLNQTGWMHNRLRMIAASFLTKDLLVNWQWGERYFEQHLADADLAQNNGGWQWAASTGTDAAPYFRVFNPVLQGKKFDPSGAFVRAMVPELANVPDAYVHAPWEMPPIIAAEAGCTIGVDYPAPLVDHFEARDRAIRAYADVIGNKAKRASNRG